MTLTDDQQLKPSAHGAQVVERNGASVGLVQQRSGTAPLRVLTFGRSAKEMLR